MDTRMIGIVAGLVLGIVFVWLGALNAFFVGLFMLAGWLLSKVLTGEVDLLELYERFLQSRGRAGKNR